MPARPAGPASPRIHGNRPRARAPGGGLVRWRCPGRRARAARACPGPGFRQGASEHPLARCEPGKVTLLKLIRPSDQQRQRAGFARDRDERRGGACPGDLLDEIAVAIASATCAAVPLRNVYGVQVSARRRATRIPAELPGLIAPQRLGERSCRRRRRAPTEHRAPRRERRAGIRGPGQPPPVTHNADQQTPIRER